MVTPAASERAHQLPHVPAQLDVDARRRLVEEQDPRLVRQRLGDQQAPLHAARERHDPVVLLVPERQVAQHLLDVRGIGRLAEQAAAEGHACPSRLERVGRQLLRHQADQRARRAVVAHDVVAVDADLPSLGLTMPQTMPISVVLPAPFGPSSAKISPRRISRLTFFSAWKPEA